MEGQGVTQEEFGRIKRAVRSALPGFRLSITLRNDFYIRVALMTGPVAAPRNEAIRLRGHVADLKGRPELAKVFRTITKAIKAAKPPKIVHRFGWGPSAMSYEIELTIGSHYRDYKCHADTATAAVLAAS